MKLKQLGLFAILFLFIFWAGPAVGADPIPVPMPCDPAVDCPPIEPCKPAPERCKEGNGPISQEKPAKEEPAE